MFFWPRFPAYGHSPMSTETNPERATDEDHDIDTDETSLGQVLGHPAAESSTTAPLTNYAAVFCGTSSRWRFAFDDSGSLFRLAFEPMCRDDESATRHSVGSRLDSLAPM